MIGLASVSYFTDFWGKITINAILKTEKICKETDSGDNQYKKGQTKTIVNDKEEYNKIDYCYNRNKKLKEYYCKGNKIKSKDYNCKNGCNGGACLKSLTNILPLNKQYQMNVLAIRYFPLKQGSDSSRPETAIIDINITGDYQETLAVARAHADYVENNLMRILTNASRYHGYKDESASPSLNYTIVQRIEHLSDVPLNTTPSYIDYRCNGFSRCLSDYRILKNENICEWVDKKGVKEVWLWANWPSLGGTSESRMSSKYGEVANGYGEPLPICNNSYILYNYNPGRDIEEAMEDHMHQLESEFSYLEGEDHLFQSINEENIGKINHATFLGPSGILKLTQSCGLAHCPPNVYCGYHEDYPPGEDYLIDIQRYVWTDCEDWKPDGIGAKQYINCERWGCNRIGFFTWWMQNLPGKDNNLSYEGHKLSNWWKFIGDWDNSIEVIFNNPEGRNDWLVEY